MIIITCEHGGNRIPSAYQSLFANSGDVLDTHASYDLGALATARSMATYFGAPLFAARTSRLLVDLNRSVGHPRLFSRFTRNLAPGEKQTLLKKYYLSHRDPIQHAVAQAIAAGTPVLHIACHSFTPILDGKERVMDVGLLYDPHRATERDLCRRWKDAMLRHAPLLNISRNAPYKGVSDGLAAYFRKVFDQRYVGIELELNQRVYLQGPAAWRRLNQLVIKGLAEVDEVKKKQPPTRH